MKSLDDDGTHKRNPLPKGGGFFYLYMSHGSIIFVMRKKRNGNKQHKIYLRVLKICVNFVLQ